ncbi:MAG: mechanosensitive ion channel [Leptospiraceae bacterium]|nr:mechanosensitive ion channel [Leptospiraceae bacterium]
MEIIKHWFQYLTGLSHENQQKLIASIFFIVLISAIRYAVGRYIWQKVEEVKMRYRYKNLSTYFFYSIFFLILGRIWIQGFESIATVVGLISAGIAFALQDIVKSIAGWIFIIWRRPFVVGDRIEIAKMKGDVIDIRLFQFTILEIANRFESEQSTGRIIHIPNSLIFNESVANYVSGFAYIWNEIDVLITFESDWKKAKSILQKIADKFSKEINDHAKQKIFEASMRYMIYYSNLSPRVYTSVKDSGVLLTIRYLTEPKRKRNTEEEFWEEILNQFDEHKDIELAYPTQRIYYQSSDDMKG